MIIKENLITTDQAYAMETMARILSIIKNRHAKKDRRWYARYHSNTTKYKHDYLRKIEIRMKLLAATKMPVNDNTIALSNPSQKTP